MREVVTLFDAMPDEPNDEDWQRLNNPLTAEAERRIEDLRRTLDDLASDEPLCSLPGPKGT